MFQKLVSHNDDIRRLVDKGYAVGFDSNYLIVRDIPYLDGRGSTCVGVIVTKLEFVNKEKVIQDDHQIFFAGGVPHGLDGKPIANLGGGPTTLTLSEAADDVVVERSFSNKPVINGQVVGAFPNFFDKIENYVGIISGPAIERNNANPYTFRVSEDVFEDSVFKFQDTLTSKAEITELSGKFHDDVIAIIGLGGTGAYILDLIVKTPVKEIRGFDLDNFHIHNAFRSPGRLDEAELGKAKVEVYNARYENFRNGLSLIAKFIEPSCIEDFEGITFAFVCVDKGPARAGIFDLLLAKRIPFIDVSMGLNRKHGALNGMLRTTYFSADQGKAVRAMALAEESDGINELYKTNIQIAELNAFNACLAVLKFKQLRGFYFEEGSVFHQLFEIGDGKIQGLGEHEIPT